MLFFKKDHAFPAAKTLAPAVFIGLCLWTCAKGVLPLLHDSELYFWLNTYGNGFVRRGLIGTLLAPAWSDFSPDSLDRVAAGCWLFGLAGTILLLWVMLSSALAVPVRALVATVGCLAATAPFLGLVAFHIGYPDSLLAAILLFYGWCLPAMPAPVIAVSLVAICAVHELAFLLLLPVVAFDLVMRQGMRRRDVAVVAMGAAVALSLPFMSGPPAPSLIDHLVSAGISKADAISLSDTALQQRFVQTFAKMTGLWRGYTLNGVLGICYAGLPGFLITALGLPSARSWIAQRTGSPVRRACLTFFYLGACLGGLAVLAIAIDLARLASFTTLTAFITLHLVLRNTRRAPRHALVALSLVCAGCFAALPLVNLYFDYARPLRLGMVATICPPCATAGRSFADYFNRGQTPEQRHRLDTDSKFGNSF